MLILSGGIGSLTDIKEAYRMVPVDPKTNAFDNPQNDLVYADRIGLHLTPKIFMAVADATNRY